MLHNIYAYFQILNNDTLFIIVIITDNNSFSTLLTKHHFFMLKIVTSDDTISEDSFEQLIDNTQKIGSNKENFLSEFETEDAEDAEDAIRV